MEENNSHCFLLPPSSGFSQPEVAALTDMVFLSVFKATPTLWQPMAAATLDLLLAMAISSQVSGFVSWGFGDMGRGLHGGGGGGAGAVLKRTSSHLGPFTDQPIDLTGSECSF